MCVFETAQERVPSNVAQERACPPREVAPRLPAAALRSNVQVETTTTKIQISHRLLIGVLLLRAVSLGLPSPTPSQARFELARCDAVHFFRLLERLAWRTANAFRRRFFGEMRGENGHFTLIKVRGEAEFHTELHPATQCCSPAKLLLPLLSCWLSLVLACGCSSCTAGELAALLLCLQQIKKACSAQRMVTCTADVHRRPRHS